MGIDSPARPGSTRRAVLAGLGASLAATRLPARAKAALPSLYPDAGQVEARLRAVPGMRVRQIGLTGRRRPIPMFSLGEGASSLLVVAGAHANEPVGGIAACLIAERIARGDIPEGARGFAWNFIGCADPDGLAMNRDWLHGPITPARYFAGFFRPPFELQPEYAFPMRVDDYHFAASTPENLAWQKALVLTRPALQIGLHGADYGGAFYLTDRPSPALLQSLGEQPGRFGLTLNPFGEPFSDMPRHAAGLFGFIDIAAFVKANRGERAAMWVAGESSARFAAQRYGCANLVSEAPMWEDPRLRETGPSGRSLVDVVRNHRARLERLKDIVLPFYAALPRGGGDAARNALMSAVAEADRVTALQLGFADRLLPSLPKEALSIRDFAIYDTALAFIGLRPVAMLARLTRSPVLAAELDRGVRALADGAPLHLVPPERVAAMQAESALLAASIILRS